MRLLQRQLVSFKRSTKTRMVFWLLSQLFLMRQITVRLQSLKYAP